MSESIRFRPWHAAVFLGAVTAVFSRLFSARATRPTTASCQAAQGAAGLGVPGGLERAKRPATLRRPVDPQRQGTGPEQADRPPRPQLAALWPLHPGLLPRAKPQARRARR